MKKENLENKNNKSVDDVTREINLDELYDGSINNTVSIDPITKEKLLVKDKKNNFIILGIILCILVLLVLYFITNNTELGSNYKYVTPKTTVTTTKAPVENHKNGILNCKLNSSSETDEQTITFEALIDNDFAIKSTFKYIAILNSDQDSALIDKLKNEYENLYVNNSNLTNIKFEFEKNDKGFTFISNTDYKNKNFDDIMINPEETVLFVKPQKNDTYDNLYKKYTEKGLSCTLTEKTIYEDEK